MLELFRDKSSEGAEMPEVRIQQAQAESEREQEIISTFLHIVLLLFFAYQRCEFHMAAAGL
jgi:hypothetical protein